MGLDGLRTTISIIHLDICILIQEGTASVTTMTMETLEGILLPLSFFKGTALYRLSYARRSVHGLTKTKISRLSHHTGKLGQKCFGRAPNI